MSAAAAPPPGIPRALARERAALVSDLRYKLSFTLRKAADAAPGEAAITFKLAQPAELLLDYREGKVRSLAANGQALAPEIVNGHLQLPASALRAGENSVTVAFDSPVAAAGKAFIRYLDRDDGTEYVYTLFVPMDASMAFPCFDQPDLKARFTLKVDAPREWQTIANTIEVKRGEFAETQPISTYLFAFASGPFRKIGPSVGMTTLWVRPSQYKRAEQEAREVLDVTDRGMAFLNQFFDYRFPWTKYDLVLIPGFAFGGMEHVGATFLREDAILFRTRPTVSDKQNRARLLLHELTHQWFGDLVTMKWFDDLWLKEGFANYMAFRALETLSPASNTWKRFYETIRPAAYGIDITHGTTPIYQEIPNLADAKSAYGAIVYQKAPALLRQLAFVLGETGFRDGLRLYLKEHAFANAEWSDLVSALERSSGRKLDTFAAAWIRRRGMPRVTVDWSCEGGRIRSLTLAQQDVLGEGGLWPLETMVALHSDGGEPVVLRARLNGPQARVPEAEGRACPAWVFSNHGDEGYGLFLLDPVSLRAVQRELGKTADPFVRSMLWGALWDTVREGGLPVADYLRLAVELLTAERDEAIVQTTLPRAATALHRYLSQPGEWPARLESLAAAQMIAAPSADLRTLWFRAFRGLIETPAGFARAGELLDGKLAIAEVPLEKLDRWNLVAALVARGAPAALDRLEAEKRRDPSGEGLKYAWIAAAGQPDAAVKRRYFDDYLHNAKLQEDWVEGSLAAFNARGQSNLTLQYLEPALAALPQVKRERRIFFLLVWLNAFIGAHHSEAAQSVVRKYLETAQPDPDLRRKILEVADELDRAVRLRKAG